MAQNQATLIMAATHLGNPADIPQRTLHWLRVADLLIFEEDRPARAALKQAGIHRDYHKFTEHREETTLEALKECLAAGKTACYMSDQGSPGLCDPGDQLVGIAFARDARVIPIPGPSSLAAAISVCPFPIDQFSFLGFLPRQDRERSHILRSHRECSIILDTPYRLASLLSAAAREFPDRKACLCLDISGANETIAFGSLQELSSRYSGKQKWNFVLILADN